jgi:DNA polymerase-3 subunit alpha
VGGLITNVRTLITKSGSKMAFVKIEDKFGDIEVTVFPRTFEEIGGKLIVDTVVKVAGKVNSRDRDGYMTDEAKINAEEIDIITDEELENYQSTGAKLKTPTKGVSQKPRGKVAATDVAKNGNGGGFRRGDDKPATHFRTTESDANAAPAKPKKLFIRVMDPTNKDALMGLKQSCAAYPGLSEVILVIGEEKKAMRMPFRCEPVEALTKELSDIFSEENVVVK